MLPPADGKAICVSVSLTETPNVPVVMGILFLSLKGSLDIYAHPRKLRRLQDETYGFTSSFEDVYCPYKVVNGSVQT